jgi:hypothetical protein
VRARPEAITAVLLDPAAYSQAVPALIRAEVEVTRSASAGAVPDRLLAWELEIPLFNLEGKAWLTKRGDLVELTFVQGAFAPGRARFRSTAVSAVETVLTCDLQIDVRAGNWLTRRLAGHDPWAETAMTAAASWVLARAVALRAEGAHGAAARRPKDPMGAPDADKLDGSLLGEPELASLRAAGTLAAVRRTPAGRLAWVSVAMPVKQAEVEAAKRLAVPETWRAFPGWKKLRRLPDPADRRDAGAAAGGERALRVQVEDNMAFVDFDAVWQVPPGPPGRAKAVSGAIAGAAFRWDARPADPGNPAAGTLAIFSYHPHLHAAGMIERRFIAAEPLLEHGLALALTYVDAAAVADALDH